jgi:hypothetical protein
VRIVVCSIRNRIRNLSALGITSYIFPCFVKVIREASFMYYPATRASLFEQPNGFPIDVRFPIPCTLRLVDALRLSSSSFFFFGQPPNPTPPPTLVSLLASLQQGLE